MLILMTGIIHVVLTDVWKSQPIYVTAYSYVFGSVFMGCASLYHVATKQYHAFAIHREVSSR